jgi:hypothetical protein
MPIFSIAFVLLLSCSMVTPPNLVVVVGGVTVGVPAEEEESRGIKRRSGAARGRSEPPIAVSVLPLHEL